jgi:hypothetical protein
MLFHVSACRAATASRPDQGAATVIGGRATDGPRVHLGTRDAIERPLERRHHRRAGGDRRSHVLPEPRTRSFGSQSGTPIIGRTGRRPARPEADLETAARRRGRASAPGGPASPVAEGDLGRPAGQPDRPRRAGQAGQPPSTTRTTVRGFVQSTKWSAQPGDLDAGAPLPGPRARAARATGRSQEQHPEANRTAHRRSLARMRLALPSILTGGDARADDPGRLGRVPIGAIPRLPESKVRTGAWPAEGAVERSEREFSELLADGVATPATTCGPIVDETGANRRHACGSGRSTSAAGGRASSTTFEVSAAQRPWVTAASARGARAACARAGLRRDRAPRLRDNEVARNLYRSSGYIETDVQMRKSLG